jgi:hypothetical protein
MGRPYQMMTMAAPTHSYFPTSCPFAKGQEEQRAHSCAPLHSAHGGKAGIGSCRRGHRQISQPPSQVSPVSREGEGLGVRGTRTVRA